MTMKASEIVTRYTEGRMAARPEYYSGRGATISDLNSKLLEGIYQGILKEIGPGAADQFVLMVEDLDRVSATYFLNSLYALEANGWVWVKADAPSKSMDHMDLGRDKEGLEVVGFATFASWAFGGSDRDDTFLIRTDFLVARGRSPKLSERNYFWPDPDHESAKR